MPVFLSYEECVARLPFLLGDDIQSTIVSLRAPGSGARLRVPVRTPLCDHIDVFECPEEDDGEVVCPVCGRFATLEELEVDSFFADLLERTDAETPAVEVTTDGEMKEVAGAAPAAKRKKLNQAPPPEPVIIELVSSDED